jgi:MFS-type transporter involved in bile tolerance (Atg22 family)
MERTAQKMLVAGVLAACLTAVFALPLSVHAEDVVGSSSAYGQPQLHTATHFRTKETGPWLP